MKTEKAKHTPGPIEHDHDGIWIAELLEYRIKELRPKQKTIDVKFSLGSAQTLARVLREEAQQRADLLESSKWVCSLFGTDDPQGKQELREEIYKLRAAISKAEGREVVL